MIDALGTRIKENYENRTRYYLPRRTYTILRLDQKAGHTYTHNLTKPFDKGYMEDYDSAVVVMLSEIQGAVFAYLQSDECSILLTDFATPNTSAWFDSNIQKISSVAASILTAEFNRLRFARHTSVCKSPLWNMNSIPNAIFDCRCFTIPDRVEVMNYFRARQQDCIRNSVSMVAQSKFSHNQLHNKSQSDMHQMLYEAGVNWATDFTDGEKNGRVIVKETYRENIIYNSTYKEGLTADVERSRWVAQGAWVFTKDEGKLLNMIPKYE